MLGKYLGRIWIIIALGLLASFGWAGMLDYFTGKDSTDYVPGQIVVKFAPGTTADEVKKVAESCNATVSEWNVYNDAHVFTVNSISTSATGEIGRRELVNVSNELAITTNIISANPRWTLKLSSVPNDPLFNKQWNLTMVNFPDAWDLPLGKNPIIVAVLDSNFDTDHPDLSGRFILPGRDVAEDDDDVRPPLDNQDKPIVTTSHGTQVSGIICAATDNNVAIAGAGWSDVKVLPIKIQKDATKNINGTVVEYSIFEDDVIQALQYIQTLVPIPQVVNMSFSGTVSQNLYAELVNLYDEGTILVAAAGNDSSDNIGAPAVYDIVMSVGAVAPNKSHASYSNTGKVDFAAPGGITGLSQDRITTLDMMGESVDPVTTKSVGTSMAAPHVTAAVAMLLSAGVDSEDVYDVLADGADNLGRSVPNEYYGNGLIDILKSFRMAKLAGPDVEILTPEDSSTYETRQVPLNIRFFNLSETAPLYVQIDDEEPIDLIDDVTFSVTDPDNSVLDTSVMLSPGTHRIIITSTAANSIQTTVEDMTITVQPHIIKRGRNFLAIPFPTDELIPEDVLGTDFALYRYVNGEDGYRRYFSSDDWEKDSEAGFSPVNQGVDFTPPVGVAWFADLAGDKAVDVYTLPVDTEYSLPLNVTLNSSAQVVDGWNMIGNPYPYRVDWATSQVEYEGRRYSIADASDAGIIRPEIWRYENGGYTFETVPGGALYAWEGAWVYALKNCILYLKPIPSPLPLRAEMARAYTSNEWKLKIGVSAGSLTDSCNEIGVLRSVSSMDAKIPEPPVLSPFVNLSLVSGQSKQLYAKDIRTAKANLIWDFVVTTDQRNSQVTINWSPLVRPGKGITLSLQDMQTKRAIDMNKYNSYTFKSGKNGDKRSFRVIMRMQSVRNSK